MIFERARFNRRNQLPGETVEEYVTVLFNLVDSCNYGELRDEMLRDRLVVGIRDMALSERLQMDSKLTLGKAMKLVRQQEAVHQHNSQLQGNLETKDSGDLSLLKYKGAYSREKETLPDVLDVGKALTKGENNALQALPLVLSASRKDILLHNVSPRQSKQQLTKLILIPFSLMP